LANFYAATEDKHNPLVSPINADLQGFPPLRIDVGSDEILLDDSLQVADHAKAANVPVELTVWEGMWHVLVVSMYLAGYNIRYAKYAFFCQWMLRSTK
jgi:epsilon-lactone hydrolase